MSKVNKDVSRFPWVFWVSISIRCKWFSYWWKTRGANFIEYQAWIFRITIGRPWLVNTVHRFRKDFGSHDHIRETNRLNLRKTFSILIKPRE